MNPDDIVRVKDGTTEDMPEGGEALGITRDVDYGGWLVRRGDVAQLHAILDARNEKLTAAYRDQNAQREVVLAALGIEKRRGPPRRDMPFADYMTEIHRSTRGIAGVKAYGGSED